MDKQELKKQLFKELFGAMIDVKYCELTESEVIRIACGAIRQFSDAYTVNHAITKMSFKDLSDETKYRQLSWSTFGFKTQAEDFKKNIINSGATAQ